MMDWGYWIVVGLFAGFLAKMQFPAKQDQNLFLLLAVGSVGAIVGGWFMHSIGGTGVLSWVGWSYAVAFLGAVLLLAIQRGLTLQPAGKRNRPGF